MLLIITFSVSQCKHSITSYIHIDVNESRQIYLPRFININMNVGSANVMVIIYLLTYKVIEK